MIISKTPLRVSFAGGGTDYGRFEVIVSSSGSANCKRWAERLFIHIHLTV
jgi:hypothetical protein